MITRALPTLYLLACGFILGLTTACVYAAVAAWDRRRDARRAERRARPHSARVGSAKQDAAAILAALDKEPLPPAMQDWLDEWNARPNGADVSDLITIEPAPGKEQRHG